MNEQYLKNVVEAALLAAGRPLRVDELRDLFDEFERPELDAISSAVATLAVDYESRGLELKEVASGWRIQVRESVAAPVSRLWQERPAKYSRAFLETLALIAYRQPITRGEIEEIRGVAVNPNIVKTLMERGWIRVVGHREVPGRPEVLGTTREFLDYFGLRSLDDLPTLAQLRDIETLGVQLEFPGAPPPRVSEAADVQTAGATAGDVPVGDAAARSDGLDELASGGAPEIAADSAEQVLESSGEQDEPDSSTPHPSGPDAGKGSDDDPEEGQVRAAGLVAADGSGTAVREPRD